MINRKMYVLHFPRFNIILLIIIIYIIIIYMVTRIGVFFGYFVFFDKINLIS